MAHYLFQGGYAAPAWFVPSLAHRVRDGERPAYSAHGDPDPRGNGVERPRASASVDARHSMLQ
jgi:hypothetical protein